MKHYTFGNGHRKTNNSDTSIMRGKMKKVIIGLMVFSFFGVSSGFCDRWVITKQENYESGIPVSVQTNTYVLWIAPILLLLLGALVLRSSIKKRAALLKDQ